MYPELSYYSVDIWYQCCCCVVSPTGRIVFLLTALCDGCVWLKPRTIRTYSYVRTRMFFFVLLHFTSTARAKYFQIVLQDTAWDKKNAKYDKDSRFAFMEKFWKMQRLDTSTCFNQSPTTVVHTAARQGKG